MTELVKPVVKPKARVFALYLPQYHPVKENDEWWGKGFTEWTNVGKAKPLFKGHHQPRVPADLGYYDLRVPEVREEQALLAKEAGVESFLYWHYWFGNGRRILERPFNEVLQSGKPDFPFCLGWANHSWSNNTWLSDKQHDKRTLIEQTYPGMADYEKHFYSLLEAFHDKRYTRVKNKPLFLVYQPLDLVEPNAFIDLWNNLAVKNGLDGIYFIGLCQWTKDHPAVWKMGFDAINSFGSWEAAYKLNGKLYTQARNVITRYLNGFIINRIAYKDIMRTLFTELDKMPNVYPSIIPQWDRTARAGRQAGMYVGSTPELFKKHVQDALAIIAHKPEEHKILILRSWNEWAEGNYVEPDLKYGKGFLNALKEALL